MDSAEYRRLIAAFVLTAGGLQLFATTTDCWSAEREVVPPTMPPLTRIVPVEPVPVSLPLILPVDSPVETFWNGPTIPFAPRVATGDQEVESLRPIPSNSRHWTDSTKRSLFADALVRPVEYPLWDWREEYETVPERLEVAIRKSCTDHELARLQRMFREALAAGRLEDANRALRMLQSKGACTKDQLIELDLVLHDARYRATSDRRHHQVGYTPTDGEVYRRVFRGRLQPKSWEEVGSSEVSFHFQGATLSEVAAFFHFATGATVRIELEPTSESHRPGDIHIRCRNQSVEKGLRVVLGSRGLGYAFIDGELVIGTPERIRQQVVSYGHRVESHWTP